LLQSVITFSARARTVINCQHNEMKLKHNSLETVLQVECVCELSIRSLFFTSVQYISNVNVFLPCKDSIVRQTRSFNRSYCVCY